MWASGHPAFPFSHVGAALQPTWFVVKHFAGPVPYCSDSFLDKNKARGMRGSAAQTPVGPEMDSRTCLVKGPTLRGV